MPEVFRFTAGTSPLLISVPHDGRQLPPALRDDLTEAGMTLKDTDWHVARLYNFVDDLSASVLAATHSRYVIDLNRSPDDAALYPGQTSTGLCPSETFGGQALYRRGPPDAEETRRRVRTFWQPYHDQLRQTLAQLKDQYGYALLWDAHSIASEVPRLFPGRLPTLNLGSNDGMSCATPVSHAVFAAAQASGYSSIHNGRFKGGFITRHYGRPQESIHALQLEIAQRAYMDESSGRFAPAKAVQLRTTLRTLLDTFLSSAAAQAQRTN
ncbi:MAG: N-formylglutamate deformylase [Pseudomonadota bacterium]